MGIFSLSGTVLASGLQCYDSTGLTLPRQTGETADEHKARQWKTRQNPWKCAGGMKVTRKNSSNNYCALFIMYAATCVCEGKSVDLNASDSLLQSSFKLYLKTMRQNVNQ